MKAIVWEVKCYHCSRVCGLLAGAPGPIVLLGDSSRVRKVPHCGVFERRGPQCSQCGGQLYTEEADGFYAIEALHSSAVN
ncbi:MAG: hypothetical protein V3U79_04905 [Dehalococcoidia bacterium]